MRTTRAYSKPSSPKGLAQKLWRCVPALIFEMIVQFHERWVYSQSMRLHPLEAQIFSNNCQQTVSSTSAIVCR